jgi:hypothetical protein
MIYALNTAWRKLMRVFGIKPFIIRIIDDITYTNEKYKMFMAIFSLHSKYYDVVDFDHLFFDTLDRVFMIEIYSNQCSYLDIAYKMIADDEIDEYELRKELLFWIYNEPFLRDLILRETPQATVEIEPILTDATRI